VRHSAIRGLYHSGHTKNDCTATALHQSGSSSAHHDMPQSSNPHRQKRQAKNSRQTAPSSVRPFQLHTPDLIRSSSSPTSQGYDQGPPLPPALPQLTRAQSFVSYLFLLLSHHTANLISSPQFLPITLGRQTPTWREHWMRVCHPSLPCCM
jgi:hypothetical protein